MSARNIAPRFTPLMTVNQKRRKPLLNFMRQRLKRSGYRALTTEIAAAGEFFYAEDYHQQYLAKNPGGYCGLGGTGIACPGMESVSAA